MGYSADKMNEDDLIL